jgi:replicative DNA helicase
MSNNQPQPFPPDSDEDQISSRGLPANTEAEQALLAAILFDQQYYELAAAAQLGTEEFFLSRHQYVWNAMQRIVEAGLAIDRVSVYTNLQSHHTQSPVSLTYIVDMDKQLPPILTATHVQSYVDMIREKARSRRLVFESQKTMNRALLGEDSTEIIRDLVDTVQAMPDADTSSGLQSLSEFIQTFEGGLEAFLDPQKRPRGIYTGFRKFDEMTTGLHDGELIIIAARPSMGKTALAINIAQNIACHPDGGSPVAVFSLEMSKDSLFTRMLCSAARVDQQKFRHSFLNSDDRHRLSEAMSTLLDAPLLIDDSAALTVADIYTRARKMQREQGLALVVVDYLQLMAGKGKQENRQQEVSAISRGLKMAAKDLKVPFLVLSQLSRKPEDRPGDHRPQLNDLRESGAIEQDADLVGFIYREEVYKPDIVELQGIATLIIGKQRNGPIGDIKLVFMKEFTRFENPLNLFGDEPPQAQ